MKINFLSTVISISSFFTLFCLAFAGDWPNWRGPNHDGSAVESKSPSDFSKTKNVKWKLTLPGPSAATPIIWKDKVFLSSVESQKENLLAMCLNRNDGSVIWSKIAGSGYQPKGHGKKHQMDSKSNYASPSPVTDGKVVVFFYGNGDLVAFDYAGKKLWNSNLQKDYGDFSFQWTFASSPTLYENRLYLQILQRDKPVHGRGKNGNESYILCVEPNSGKKLWKHKRPSKAKMESLESFATPIPYVHNGRKEIIIAGGDVLTGHDPVSGKELWRWGTWNKDNRQEWWRLVPSPVIGNGVVLACAPKKAPVYAVKLGGAGHMKMESGMVWNSSDIKEVTSDVPTPLFYRDHFFVLSDLKRALSCIEPKTGKVLWKIKMPGRFKWRGSPTACDGKIYIMNHGGDVVIIDHKSGAILKNIPMGVEKDDNIRSSIAISNGELFIRTNSEIFCIK